MTETSQDDVACPFCAEPIKKAAVYCKHCKRSIETSRSASKSTVSPPPSPVAPPAQVLVVPSPQTYNSENSTGLWAMIFGIVGLVIPCLIFPPIIAIAGGFAGVGKVNKGKANNMGQCTAAIVTGFIGLGLTVISYLVAIAALSSGT